MFFKDQQRSWTINFDLEQIYKSPQKIFIVSLSFPLLFSVILFNYSWFQSIIFGLFQILFLRKFCFGILAKLSHHLLCKKSVQGYTIMSWNLVDMTAILTFSQEMAKANLRQYQNCTETWAPILNDKVLTSLQNYSLSVTQSRQTFTAYLIYARCFNRQPFSQH